MSLNIWVNRVMGKEVIPQEDNLTPLERHLAECGYKEHPGNQGCNARYFVNGMDIVCVSGDQASWTWHHSVKAQGSQGFVLDKLKADSERRNNDAKEKI